MKTTHILVVPSSAVGSAVEVRDYLPIDGDKGIEHYLPFTTFHAGYRMDMEDDPSYRQIIPYISFMQNDKMFVYERSPKGNEERLHDAWSCGIGGHVDLVDFVFGEDAPASEAQLPVQAEARGGETKGMIPQVLPVPSLDLAATIAQSTAREIKEELGIDIDASSIQFSGFIVSNENAVSRVHVGLHAVVMLEPGVELTVDPATVADHKFVTGAELKQMKGLEAWTQLIADKL